MTSEHKHEGRGLREIADDGTFTDVCPCGATQAGHRDSATERYTFDAWKDESEESNDE